MIKIISEESDSMHIGNIILKLDVSIWVLAEELRLTLHAFRWEKGGLKCRLHNSF